MSLISPVYFTQCVLVSVSSEGGKEAWLNAVTDLRRESWICSYYQLAPFVKLLNSCNMSTFWFRVILNFWPHPFNEFIPHPSNSVNHHFGVLTAYVTKSIEVIKVQSVQIFGLIY